MGAGVDFNHRHWRHTGRILAALAFAPAVILGQPALPNLVFYIADDQGQREASAYGAPALLQTPTIDRLARDGMVFDNAFVA
jgi:hypothetical protein